MKKKVGSRFICLFVVCVFVLSFDAFGITGKCDMSVEDLVTEYFAWEQRMPDISEMLDVKWENVDLIDELTSNSVNVVEHEDYYDIFCAVKVSGKFADVVPYSDEAYALLTTNTQREAYEYAGEYAYINDWSDKLKGRTYKELALDAVVSAWQGEYRGKPVKVRIMDISDTYDSTFRLAYGNYIEWRIDITPQNRYNDAYEFSRGSGRASTRIDTPAGVSREKGVMRSSAIISQAWIDFIDLEVFMGSAVHEFGHALGLPDVYLDDISIQPLFEHTVMGGCIYEKAAPFEYHMFLDHPFKECSENIQNRKYSKDKIIEPALKEIARMKSEKVVLSMFSSIFGKSYGFPF